MLEGWHRCDYCGSDLVVGLENYKRCLMCHACCVKKNERWQRTTDTPNMFRLTNRDEAPSFSQTSVDETLPAPCEPQPQMDRHAEVEKLIAVQVVASDPALWDWWIPVPASHDEEPEK